eukprot:Protomagalhaensia_sp_Gyna_25__3741@NODE_3361_length_606_cov_667_114638_g2818_i0_p1_GENE_NODE_3361_length_606_cov_667_114638_g2818_i0NODE_3361_length_606_cov_667_114638_g2818_i0_p1_ORF_typecomplete_len119_score6_50_NODE_3361_length_606_cov_667_114638_g2818_i0208564
MYGFFASADIDFHSSPTILPTSRTFAFSSGRSSNKAGRRFPKYQKNADIGLFGPLFSFLEPVFLTAVSLAIVKCKCHQARIRRIEGMQRRKIRTSRKRTKTKPECAKQNVFVCTVAHS